MKATDSPESGEHTSGLRSVLSLAWAYRLSQSAIGADRYRTVFVDEILRPNLDDRVLDIGCGTADILDHLPTLDYIGFDHSERYVAGARQRFGDRGVFFASTGSNFELPQSDRTIAMSIGVLHHLADAEAESVLRLARDSLIPGGRFVSIDPTLDDGQHPVARFLVKRDRGQFVRSPEQMAELVSGTFQSADVSTRHDLLRTPYSHVIVQASTERS